MQPTYVLVKTNWTGTRYSARDAGGRELYTVKGSFRSFKFIPPGSEEPRFEAKAVGFFSLEYAFVESAVNYVFAYLKPRKRGSLEELSILNVARSEVGVFKNGLTQDTISAAIEPMNSQSVSKWAAFKAACNKLSEVARTSELLVDEKPVVRFEVAKDRKSVTATVLNSYIKDIDERVILILALRAISNQQASNSGG
jgi:hypothetical protein